MTFRLGYRKVLRFFLKTLDNVKHSIGGFVAYRKSMSRRGSKRHFRKNTKVKSINHVGAMGNRGGIRL